MLKVFLFDRIPSFNKGEEAILRGLLKVLHSLDAQAELTIYSAHPDRDREKYSPDTKVVGPGILRFHPVFLRWPSMILYIVLHLIFLVLFKSIGKNAFKIMSNEIWKSYSEADVVFIGHDDMMASRNFSPPYIGSVILAKGLGKQVVVCAGSIGPFESGFSRFLARSVLRHVDLIAVREEISKEWCLEAGLSAGKVFYTGDLAILMDACGSDRVLEIWKDERLPLRSGEKPLIGMTAVRGSLVFQNAFSVSQPDLSLKQRYEQHCLVLSRLVDALIEKINADIIFVPHVIGPGRELDDRAVARDILAGVKNSDRVHLIETDYCASELKGIIGQCDMFIGERTHSVIGAITMGVPSIAISFPTDHRTYGIIGKSFQQERWLYNIENMEADELILLAEKCWQERNATKSLLKSSVEKTYKSAFRFVHLLRDILGRRELS